MSGPGAAVPAGAAATGAALLAVLAGKTPQFRGGLSVFRGRKTFPGLPVLSAAFRLRYHRSRPMEICGPPAGSLPPHRREAMSRPSTTAPTTPQKPMPLFAPSGLWASGSASASGASSKCSSEKPSSATMHSP